MFSAAFPFRVSKKPIRTEFNSGPIYSAPMQRHRNSIWCNCLSSIVRWLANEMRIIEIRCERECEMVFCSNGKCTFAATAGNCITDVERTATDHISCPSTVEQMGENVSENKYNSHLLEINNWWVLCPSHPDILSRNVWYLSNGMLFV